MIVIIYTKNARFYTINVGLLEGLDIAWEGVFMSIEAMPDSDKQPRLHENRIISVDELQPGMPLERVTVGTSMEISGISINTDRPNKIVIVSIGQRTAHERNDLVKWGVDELVDDPHFIIWRSAGPHDPLIYFQESLGGLGMEKVEIEAGEEPEWRQMPPYYLRWQENG